MSIAAASLGLSLGLSLKQYGGGTRPPGVDNYLRPDALSLYRRPDTTSLYKRPLI